LKLDVKTVRRVIGRSTPPVRVSPPRPSVLDPWRERIMHWLREETKVTAKAHSPAADSVPTRHAYRPVCVKLYHDRVAITVGTEVVAEHRPPF